MDRSPVREWMMSGESGGVNRARMNWWKSIHLEWVNIYQGSRLEVELQDLLERI